VPTEVISGTPLFATLGAALTRPVALVGLMGVGKSSIGKRLAAQLGWPFVDADDAIESAADMPIAEIFERYGEPAFRDGERRVIRRLVDGERKVLATGGGAFIDPQTRALLLDSCHTVWLDAEIDVLVERTSRKPNRPLLAKGDPKEILTELAQRRNPLYALAPIHVHSGRQPHEASVSAILTRLAELAA
jgi:shikimate kinase